MQLVRQGAIAVNKNSFYKMGIGYFYGCSGFLLTRYYLT